MNPCKYLAVAKFNSVLKFWHWQQPFSVYIKKNNNICLHLFSVSGGLVQRLQPNVTQSQHGVCVVLCGWLLQNTLELLLTRSPFLFGQVKVPYQGPGIWVILHQTEDNRSDSNEECDIRFLLISGVLIFNISHYNRWQSTWLICRASLNQSEAS